MSRHTKIHFIETTVYYGRTTLHQFQNFGFDINPLVRPRRNQSQAVMCGFTKNGRHIGELIFFNYNDTTELTVDDLKDLPINLVILDKRIEEEKQTFGVLCNSRGKREKKMLNF